MYIGSVTNKRSEFVNRIAYWTFENTYLHIYRVSNEARGKVHRVRQKSNTTLSTKMQGNRNVFFLFVCFLDARARLQFSQRQQQNATFTSTSVQKKKEKKKKKENDICKGKENGYRVSYCLLFWQFTNEIIDQSPFLMCANCECASCRSCCSYSLRSYSSDKTVCHSQFSSGIFWISFNELQP